MASQDSRAAVRVPFTQIVPTVVKVVDTSNEGKSGAGWTIGEGGLVRPCKHSCFGKQLVPNWGKRSKAMSGKMPHMLK